MNRQDSVIDAARLLVSVARRCGVDNDELNHFITHLDEELRALDASVADSFIGYASDRGIDWMVISVPDGTVKIPEHGTQIRLVPEPVPGREYWEGAVTDSITTRMGVVMEKPTKFKFPDAGTRLRITTKGEKEP